MSADRVYSEEDSHAEFHKAWRAWRTVKEMLRDRGYVLSEAEVKITLNEFRDLYANAEGKLPDRQKMRFSARPSEELINKFRTPGGAPPDMGPVWVEFRSDTKFGIKEMRDFVHMIAREKYGTGILITPSAITPNALKIIPTVLPSVIETFVEADLLVNISQHELVPTHVLLSVEDKARLLERYRLKETQLPRIQVNDPMARYLGLRRGQVVKIIRNSETSGRYASYRWCI